MNLFKCCHFLPLANPILAFVAACHNWVCHRKHCGAVSLYQLWQVKDSRVGAKKKRKKEEESVFGLRRCVSLCEQNTSIRVTELVGCFVVKHPETACLEGFVKV